MVTETMRGVRISLEVECGSETCADFATPLLLQLSKGYETCSVLPMPESVEEWRSENRTARKRANRALNLGYRFDEIRREEYERGVFEINLSKDTRQGRPMSRAYQERPNFLPLPDYPCERHAIRTYGVLSARGELVAYLWLYRAGDLALVSSILGHGWHEKNDVMYLLTQGAIDKQSHLGGYLVYNRHDSGTEGLRYFKTKLGFRPMEVAWAL